jgi:hypothetical protein
VLDVFVVVGSGQSDDPIPLPDESYRVRVILKIPEQ